MFASFRNRITRGYVLLAVLLIVAAVATPTTLAFMLYARELGASITGAAQRAAEEGAQFAAAHRSLAQSAPAIAHSIGRDRFHVVVFDSNHHLLAQNERREPRTPGRELSQDIARVLGLPHARVPIPGGVVVIDPDFDRFGQTLVWYWSIMLPVGIFALLAAWLIGRRITARAVGPLVDVTRSLQTIAAGDLAPERLITDSGELRELTTAYNDVVLRLAAATAERKQTEAQMRQFIADAGHELRTPLTTIMGYLDLLRAGGLRSDEAGAQHAYETMLEESRRMRALIQRLILLAKLDRPAGSGRIVPIDLSVVAQRAAKAVSPVAQEDRVALRDGVQQPIIMGDEGEIYEAIKNVLDNAVKYAPDAPIEIALYDAGPTICLRVSDAGPGMDPQDVAHAFDRFYRGSGKFDVEGSGLGLAIAKRAAERAGGSIDLESAPGEGTRITMCFPKISEAL